QSLRLQIVAVDSTSEDHADWANARVSCAAGRPPNEPPNEPPKASFTATPSHAAPWTLVIFDAETSMDPDGTIISYEWDFGDGLTDIGISVTHAYAHNGTFTVHLAVTDDLGAIDRAEGSIEIGNRVPTIVSASPQAFVVMGANEVNTFVVVASDLDGDPLTY